MRSVIVWMYYYFELLRDANKELIKIVGMDCIGNTLELEQKFCELLSKIIVLIPCRIDEKTKKVKTVHKDGIFNFSDVFSDLEESIDNLVNKNSKVFYKIKFIRNKHEHELHFVNPYGASSGSDVKTNITLKYSNPKNKKEIIELSTDELIKIMKSINNLFDDMMEQILDYLNHDKEDEEFNDVYRNRYWRIKYSDYNEIYDSPILLKISRAMK